MADTSIFDLTGRVALVTGASRGLGHALALALARAGADLAVTSRDVASLQPVVSECASLGRTALPLELDVRREESIGEAVTAALAHHGTVDILVNNAGCNVRKPSLEITWDEWNMVLETNLRGAFFVTKAVLPAMIEQGRGRIVNIGSVTSFFGFANIAPYCASRGGIRQLTMSLADELGVHGITVNALAPGYFHTAQTDVLYRDPDWVASTTARVPLGRLGEPRDLDGAVVFLASDASAYVTGQTVLVDGGITTGSMHVTPKARS